MKKKNQKKRLIFFQSSIELTQILNIVKSSLKGSCIIIVTGHENLLYSINKLNLEKKYKE